MTATKGLTIGQVARRAGLRPSAIRYYETCGLLREPARVNGWRRYDRRVFTELAAIDVAQRAGFSLEEIRALLRGVSPSAGSSPPALSLAQTKLAEIDALIARANAMKRLLKRGIECGCTGIEACPIVAERVETMTGAAKRNRTNVR